MSGYVLRWFTCPRTVTHASTNPAMHNRVSNSQPSDQKSDALTTMLPSHLAIGCITYAVLNSKKFCNKSCNNNSQKFILGIPGLTWSKAACTMHIGTSTSLGIHVWVIVNMSACIPVAAFHINARVQFAVVSVWVLFLGNWYN